ncbi:hypothetical protein [Dehalobacter sp. TBBPA1]|uniref:hypothetical protein n=1 Tax=Dehalobacter sp. TBBPA1 TaxID=3235037 RepID=UPI0034A2AC67
MAREKQGNNNEHASNGLNTVLTSKNIENTQWVKWRNKKGGHGFAAEDANAQADRFCFEKVETVGRNNQRDGADRIVHNRHGNYVSIQTKYCRTAKQTVDAAFSKETGLYRYNGQIIEVPFEQYEDAVREITEKIKAGKVPGINDPQKADLLIRQGDVTYIQAKNIAKAGNIDSLVFDIKEQSVVSLCAFGLTFAVTFASCKWNGMNITQALRLSSINTIKSGAVVMGTGVITRQFLRTSIGRNFAAFSTQNAKMVINKFYKCDIGKKSIHKLSSVISGKILKGAAAKNVVTKFARTEWPVMICLTAVTTMPDLYRAAITKEISWSQFIKNLSVNVSGAIGGIGGAATGAIIGSLIFPGVGTAIGAVLGLAGGIGGGIGSSKLVSWIADTICDDDSTQMNHIIQKVVPQLSSDFLVTEKEFAEILKEMEALIDVKWLRKMYRAGAKGKNAQDKALFQAEYVYSKLSPIFENTIVKRSMVIIPSDKEIRKDLRRINLRFYIDFLKHIIKVLFGKERQTVNQLT